LCRKREQRKEPGAKTELSIDQRPLHKKTSFGLSSRIWKSNPEELHKTSELQIVREKPLLVLGHLI
jgi:hypothetical protein